MALTLLESAKAALNGGEVKRAGVISMFAQQSAWLASLVFDSIPGNAYAYNREGVLPGVAFRGVNESYSESTGVINPLAETLKIAGGDLDVDKFIVATLGSDVRAKHEGLKIKALAAEITRVLIKGDSTSQPREFDGLQTRLSGGQVISNSAASGGAGLSLAKLDEAIDAVPGATAIWLTKSHRRRFTAAARTSSVAGNITFGQDQFGRTQTMYNGLPLLVPYEENDGTEPIVFNESYTGGGTANGSSIYVVRVGDGFFKGIQNGTMQVTDLGELDTAPVLRTRVEWYLSACLEHGRAAARLRDISDSAINA